MPTNKVKPSKVSPMGFSERLFLAGHGGNWVYQPVEQSYSESSEPIRLNRTAKGIERATEVNRKPDLEPLDTRGEWQGCRNSYDCDCERCANCLPPRRIDWPTLHLWASTLLAWVFIVRFVFWFCGKGN